MSHIEIERLSTKIARFYALPSPETTKMPEIHKEAIFPRSPEALFHQVNRIADYPQFLPWCSKTEIHHQNEHETEATLHVQKGLLRFSFRTFNRLQKPHWIEMNLVEGPFRSLLGRWEFIALGASEEATKVKFTLSYEFSNLALSMTLNPLMNQLAETFLEAFSTQCEWPKNEQLNEELLHQIDHNLSKIDKILR